MQADRRNALSYRMVQYRCVFTNKALDLIINNE
jgi:hypothetical protein